MRYPTRKPVPQVHNHPPCPTEAEMAPYRAASVIVESRCTHCHRPIYQTRGGAWGSSGGCSAGRHEPASIIAAEAFERHGDVRALRATLDADSKRNAAMAAEARADVLRQIAEAGLTARRGSGVRVKRPAYKMAA